MDQPLGQLSEPGTFPKWQLDQGGIWVDTKGLGHRILEMTEEEVLWALDYCLANAGRLRTNWAISNKAEFNIKQRPRQWMLNRKVMRALMGRLLLIEAKGERQWAP